MPSCFKLPRTANVSQICFLTALLICDLVFFYTSRLDVQNRFVAACFSAWYERRKFACKFHFSLFLFRQLSKITSCQGSTVVELC